MEDLMKIDLYELLNISVKSEEKEVNIYMSTFFLNSAFIFSAYLIL